MGLREEHDMADKSAFYNHEAERAIIAAVMKKGVAAQYAGALTPEDFYSRDHQDLWRAVQGLVISKRPVDMPCMAEMLGRLYGNDRLMGTLLDIVTNDSFGAEFAIREHIALVKSDSRRRMVYMTLRDSAEQLAERENEPDSVAETVREKLRGIGGERQTGGMGLQDVLMSAYTELERRSRGETQGMPSGIEALDRRTAGFHRGELTIIGARPAVGKSALASQIAISAAQKGNRVCVCSREMTDIQYGIRVLVRGTKVSSIRLRGGDLTDGDWGQLSDSMLLYNNCDIRFLFTVKAVEDLRREVQSMTESGGLDMLVVDYLQLLQSRQRFDKDYMRVGYVSKALKDISVDFNIAVIALAQVGRSTEGSMPTLAELRGSGDIEQDADNVIFMHRPEDAGDKWVRPDDRSLYQTLETMGGQYIVLNIAKHRQGETCAVPVVFYPAEMRFTGIGRRG